MQISATNLNYNKIQSPISFGRITPNHLFIKHRGFQRDAHWAETMVATVEHSSAKIKRGLCFRAILDYIADKYQMYFMKKQGVIEFGNMRERPISTPVGGRYESYFDAAKELATKQGEKDVVGIVPKRFFRILRDNSEGPQMEVKGDAHTMSISIKDKEIPLTRTFRVFKYPKGTKVAKNKNGESEMLIWEHTKPEYLPDLLSHANFIYSKIMKEQGSDLDKTVNNIAELHWLLCQIAPFNRGNAGIADLVTKSLFEAKSIQVSPWKKDVVPDLEALTTPLEVFKSRYASFFQKRPKYMN